MQLISPRATATISLDGGRLASLVVDDMELLVSPVERPTRWGSFPMVPWCGRLPFGELTFEGKSWNFPITSAPHANHGTAMHTAWTSDAPGRLRAELGHPWPFGGHVEQRFELTNTSLTVHMSVHAGDVPMPAQIGWHPWYRRQLDQGGPLELAFAADSIYETDANQIPTGAIVPAPDGPWDETFIGVTQTPVLRWPGALTLRLTSDLSHWVVFTELDHAVAIEPQSGAPNDLNRAPHVLAPGEVLAGWMTLAWD